MPNLKPLPILAGAVALALAAAPVASRAAIYDITSDHCGSTCITSGSLGTITVTQDGTNKVKIVADLSSSGSEFLNTGFDATLTFDLLGNPTITYSNVTSGWQLPGAPPITTFPANQSAGSLHMDGTGFWEYGIEWGTSGGGSGTFGPLSFDISASGLTPSSLEANGSAFFAIDVSSGQTGNTGIVDASPSAVPAPEIGHGLTAALTIGGLLFGARLWTRSNKRSMLPGAPA